MFALPYRQGLEDIKKKHTKNVTMQKEQDQTMYLNFFTGNSPVVLNVSLSSKFWPILQIRWQLHPIYGMHVQA